MPQNTYNTVDQEVYWSNVPNTAFATVSPVVSGVDIPSELSTVRRVVLGTDIPTADVARVAYRATIARMRVGDESEVMRTNPLGWLVLVRTDDLQAMIGPFVCSGTPLQAAAQGEIASNVQLAPWGIVSRGVAVELPTTPVGADVVVSATSPAYGIVTGGTGQFTRDGTNYPVAGNGVYFMPPGGTSVSKSAALEGWLIINTEVVTG